MENNGRLVLVKARNHQASSISPKKKNIPEMGIDG
jgi:hypothetical protein